MTDVLCDASVITKWFHAEREDEVEDARRVLHAHFEGQITASMLDLTYYEIGNVLWKKPPGTRSGSLYTSTICGQSAA